MLFTVILGLILSAMSDALPKPDAGLVGVSAWALLFAAAPVVAALVFGALFAHRRRMISDDDEGRGFALARLSGNLRRVSRAVEFAVLGSYAGGLYFGWHAVPVMLGVEGSELASRVIVFAPFLISLVATWAALHPAERIVRGPGATLAQRLSFQVRFHVLTVCVPVAVILGLADLLGLLPTQVKVALNESWIGQALVAGVVLTGYAFAPLVVVRVWKTSRLEEGPLRERLVELCRRIKVGFRDIRVWETPGHFFANAAVMGVAAPMRYIIVSRSLIAAMTTSEVEAVFAHELGHARKHHMGYYLLFAANFMLLATLFGMIAAPAVGGGVSEFVMSFAGFALYWGIGFGYFSRAFEREADLFGAESSDDARTFAVALERIARINGVSPSARSWRHGSIRSRVEFLYAAATIPEVRQKFKDKILLLKVFLVINLAVAGAAVALLQTAH
jgi:STE24 endopeptidase